MYNLTLWKPLEINAKSTLVDAIHDDCEGFRIIINILKSGGDKILIKSKDTLAYKNTKQMFLHGLWNNIDKSLGGNIFYIMENSEYLKDFHLMSEGFYSNLEIKHYCIYTLDDCIDLLCTEAPSVEWL